MPSQALDIANTILNYSCLPITALGLVGNTLMLVVFSQHALRKLSVSHYFRAIAVANLYINLNLLKIYAVYQYGYFIRDQSRFLCKSVMFLIYAIGSLSAWFFVAAGLDRLFNIIYASRFPFLQRPRTPLVVLALLTLYNVAFYFHMWFDNDLMPAVVVVVDTSNSSSSTNTTTTSDYSSNTNTILSCQNSAQSWFDLSDLINTAVVPFAIMLVSTILMFKGVIDSRYRVRKLMKRDMTMSTSTSNGDSSNNRTAKDSRMNRRTCQKGALTTTAGRVRSRDIKFAMTMVILNLFFLVTNAPNPLLNSIFPLLNISYDGELNNFLGNLSVVIYYFFYSATFYVQLMVNSLVWQQFVKLFCRRGYATAWQTRSTLAGVGGKNNIEPSLSRTDGDGESVM